MDSKCILAFPVAGFSLIQTIKFIKLLLFYELCMTLLITIPYMIHCLPSNKIDACTQTDESDFETESVTSPKKSWYFLNYFYKHKDD